jgi:hypothetical protein
MGLWLYSLPRSLEKTSAVFAFVTLLSHALQLRLDTKDMVAGTEQYFWKTIWTMDFLFYSSMDFLLEDMWPSP